MNEPTPGFQPPNLLLHQLGEPVVWHFLSQFPPRAVRRILQVVFQELSDLALPPQGRALRDSQTVENAKRLGAALSPPKDKAFLSRYHRNQTLRQAEEILCMQGDVEAQVQWGEEKFVVKGISHARRIVKAGQGAVVVSAHLGAFVYYIPMLVYYLSKAGLLPELLAVMNAPTQPDAEKIQRQIARFAPHHAMHFGLLSKLPGGELRLFRELDQALSRNCWVLMQMDAITGGGNLQPLRFAGQELLLPGVWGAVRLAMRRGVPILPVRTWRTRSEGLGLRIETPLEVSRPAAVAAQQLAEILEGWVFRDLADWGQLENVHLLLPTRS